MEAEFDQLDAATRRRHEKTIELEETDISDFERLRRIQHNRRVNEEELAQYGRFVTSNKARLRYLHHLGKDQAEKEICVICQTDFDIGALTFCGHMYCRDCFAEWFRDHYSCPICKTYLRQNDYHTISINAPITELVPPATTQTEEILSTYYATPSDELRKAIKAIKLPQSYSSKVDTIVKHILTLPVHAKSIVYSNWPSVLEYIQIGLNHNEIKAKYLAKNNTEFLEDPDCRVLLMSGKSKAAGLNLVNATNIFLVEPLINPAIELQVCGRIHRIGQTRETSVFQYYVRNTLEARILEQSIARRASFQDVEDAEINSKMYAGSTLQDQTGEVVAVRDAVCLFQSNVGQLKERKTLLGLI